MTKFFDERRSLIGSAALLPLALGGCSLSGWSSGVSNHAGRRVVTQTVKPLNIDPSDGLAAVNAVRRKHLLPVFAMDPALQKAAQAHADLMGRTGQYGHEFGPKTKFPVRLASAGFDGSAGENIGVGYGSVDEAVQGWLDSPGHRKNMLKRRYDRAGFAYAFNTSGKNTRYTHYWVLIMGRPGRGGPARLQPV
jgi:uncharacterized protein YkwD